MSFVVGFLETISFECRVAFLICFVFLLWLLVGRIILWIMSGIPFLLIRLHRLIYCIVQIPISFLHKKFGSALYKADNGVAVIGVHIEDLLQKWYIRWHAKGKTNKKIEILCFIVIYIIIVVPPKVFSNDSVLCIPGNVYCKEESKLVNKIKAGQRKKVIIDIPEEVMQNEDETFEVTEPDLIELQVVGIRTALLIRDVPSVERGIALERLKNNDVVKWSGQLIFAETEDNRKEAWVKIISQNGIEGWSRLDYLCPTHYETEEYQVKVKSTKEETVNDQ